MGRDRVGRLIRICGLLGIVRGKLDLIDSQSSASNRPNHWWLAKFTHVRTLILRQFAVPFRPLSRPSQRPIPPVLAGHLARMRRFGLPKT